MDRDFNAIDYDNIIVIRAKLKALMNSAETEEERKEYEMELKKYARKE